VAYQPEPLSTNAPEDIFLRTLPPHEGHFLSGESLIPWSRSVISLHLPH
jgi:hypothetical protein